MKEFNDRDIAMQYANEIVGFNIREVSQTDGIKKKYMFKYSSHPVRVRLSKCARTQKMNKKLQFIIGCDFELFKAHIESMFKDEMNWANYGKWHLDHNEPTSKIHDEESFFKIMNYKNLQPLWAKENMAKGNKNNSEWKPA